MSSRPATLKLPSSEMGTKPWQRPSLLQYLHLPSPPRHSHHRLLFAKTDSTSLPKPRQQILASRLEFLRQVNRIPQLWLIEGQWCDSVLCRGSYDSFGDQVWSWQNLTLPSFNFSSKCCLETSDSWYTHKNTKGKETQKSKPENPIRLNR